MTYQWIKMNDRLVKALGFIDKPLGRAAGRKVLIANGFGVCINPSYYRKGCEVAHYNTVVKAWIIQ